MPTDPEFLLAALGTDGRVHPWGSDEVPKGAKLGQNFCPQRIGPARDWVCYVESNLLDISPYGVLGLGTNGDEMTGTCFEALRGQACVFRGDRGSGLLFGDGLIARQGAVGTQSSLGFRCATSERRH